MNLQKWFGVFNRGSVQWLFWTVICGS